MVALLTSVRNSPCFGGLRRTKTCHRQLFARPSVLFGYFLHDAKSDNPFPYRELRSSANLESAHPNNTLPRTKLNPFETFRFAESLSLSGRHTPCAFSVLFAGRKKNRRKLRGSANLESAHKKTKFTFHPYNSTYFVLYYTKGRVESLA